MLRSQLTSYNGDDPIWGFVTIVATERFTGEAVVGRSPRVHLYATDGRVYYAEREGDTALGSRLVEAGVLSANQLAFGTVEVAGVHSLARLFQRVPMIDRDAVELTVEMATESLLEAVAALPVGDVDLHPLRHHPSGIHHWLRSAGTVRHVESAVVPQVAGVDESLPAESAEWAQSAESVQPVTDDQEVTEIALDGIALDGVAAEVVVIEEIEPEPELETSTTNEDDAPRIEPEPSAAEVEPTERPPQPESQSETEGETETEAVGETETEAETETALSADLPTAAEPAEPEVATPALAPLSLTPLTPSEPPVAHEPVLEPVAPPTAEPALLSRLAPLPADSAAMFASIPEADELPPLSELTYLPPSDLPPTDLPPTDLPPTDATAPSVFDSPTAPVLADRPVPAPVTGGPTEADLFSPVGSADAGGLPKLASAPIGVEELMSSPTNESVRSPSSGQPHNLAAVEIWELVDHLIEEPSSSGTPSESPVDDSRERGRRRNKKG